MVDLLYPESVRTTIMVERGGARVRIAGLNLRKGRAGRSDGHRRYQRHAIGHAPKNPPHNRTRGSSVAGRPRDTMLIGQTYAKDVDRSCSDMPNHCDYAPTLRWPGRGEARVMKEQLREPFFGDPTIRSYEAALQRLIHLSQDQSCLPVSPARRRRIEPLQ